MSDCIFCKIVNGEIPSKKVYEDENIVGFEDINPAAPIHIVIIPKKHIESINSIKDEDTFIISEIFKGIKKIAENLGLKDEGYRVVTNCGENAGQTVMHLHFHLLGGRNLNWPPG